MPRIAISEEVSKPRPKTTPSGYIFHGRSIALNSFPSIRRHGSRGSVWVLVPVAIHGTLGESSPQALDQGVEHPPVGNAQNYEEHSADRGPNDVSYSSEAIEALSEGATGGSNNDTGDDDNCAVAQTEEGADSCRSLSTGDQSSGCEIDSRDVVSVKRMP
ncbi:unnamed protein product [Clonostachys byssicola]|uniref:Uncharacterized protein n=1 Tax=Clonostachys byssicola TaxID=160290 RepID=A0A9N9Y7H0_9HYPO|nr:unnamed protein product [Clonostachys byssicola]